jgi:hypothetical protein
MHFYGQLPVFLRLQPSFGGAPVPSFLVGDGPRMVGGEVGGGEGMGPLFLRWEGPIGEVGGVS